jgi:hypothetical protein
MNDNAWKPDPELLAAFFDGELEGRDDVADMRARIEAWIENNPQAAEEWAEHQQVKKLWAETTPAEPSAAAWGHTLSRIQAASKRPAVATSRRGWLIASVIAASVLLLIGFFAARPFWPAPAPLPDPLVEAEPENGPPEMLVVALSSEVTILRIDTDDIEGVIVGVMPVSEPLDMVSTGEALISCKCPRVAVRQDPPMAWALASKD